MKHMVIDSGFLIGLERRSAKPAALAEELRSGRIHGHVPAGVIAQVWRGDPKQHAVMRLLKAHTVHIHPLTEQAAHNVGMLLGESKTSDVVDGHVVLLARGFDAQVVTSDPGDVAKLDSALRIVTV